jgi:hypothetical protein
MKGAPMQLVHECLHAQQMAVLDGEVQWSAAVLLLFSMVAAAAAREDPTSCRLLLAAIAGAALAAHLVMFVVEWVWSTRPAGPRASSMYSILAQGVQWNQAVGGFALLLWVVPWS